MRNLTSILACAAILAAGPSDVRADDSGDGAAVVVIVPVGAFAGFVDPSPTGGSLRLRF